MWKSADDKEVTNDALTPRMTLSKSYDDLYNTLTPIFNSEISNNSPILDSEISDKSDLQLINIDTCYKKWKKLDLNKNLTIF